jgi:hypothetical protein
MTPLGECRDYDDLRAALRARCEALNISRLELDRISGIANGYSSCVLSDTARKHIGAQTIGPLLAALGLKLLVVEDPDMVAKYTVRAEPRFGSMAHTNTRQLGRTTMHRAKIALLTEFGRRGGHARFAKLSDAERTELGRRGAAKRWEQYRANRQAASGA